MTKSHRPTNHGERAICTDVVARLVASPALHPSVATLITTQFQPVCTAYEGARVDNYGAALKAAKATDDKGEAEAAFTLAFRQWLYSVFPIPGQAAVLKEIKPLLGNLTPSRFMDLPVRTRLARIPYLLFTVDRRPELTGDPRLLDAVRSTAEALRATAKVSEAAASDWTVTAKALAKVTTTFDRTYGVLVRATLAIDPDGAGALLPVFHRVSPTIEPSPTSPTSAPAPAPAPEPEPEPEPEPADEDEHGEPDEPTAEPDDPIA